MMSNSRRIGRTHHYMPGRAVRYCNPRSRTRLDRWLEHCPAAPAGPITLNNRRPTERRRLPAGNSAVARRSGMASLRRNDLATPGTRDNASLSQPPKRTTIRRYWPEIVEFPTYPPVPFWCQLRYSQDSTGRTSYAFDAAGNQQIVREPSGSRTTYGWDYDNQNTLVRMPDGTRVTMAYNADFRRTRKDT